MSPRITIRNECGQSTYYYTDTTSPSEFELVYRTGETATMTVPYACAQSPYVGNEHIDFEDLAFETGLDEDIKRASYPDLPRTAVECCMRCHQLGNCFLSSFYQANDGDGEPGRCYIVKGREGKGWDARGTKKPAASERLAQLSVWRAELPQD